jgi:hypothetical protein
LILNDLSQRVVVFIWKNNPRFERFASSNSKVGVGDNNDNIIFWTFLAAGPFRVISPELRSPFMA